jgi:uncharacterized repeat protein (TIGR01451 family)
LKSWFTNVGARRYLKSGQTKQIVGGRRLVLETWRRKMLRVKLSQLTIPVIVAVLLLVVCSSSAQESVTPAGSTLEARAYGLYKDDQGRELRTASETLKITIQTVALLYVTPNETEPSAQIEHHQELTRLFQVCNGGNAPEQVVISRIDVPPPARVVTLHFDTDGSGTISSPDQNIEVGNTHSPILQTGGCVGVMVLVNSESFPARTNLPIRLTARTTTVTAANGIQEVTGQIVNKVIAGARITGPAGDDPPLLLVNDLKQIVTTSNQVIRYSLVLRNSGDDTAHGIDFTDDLPAGLEYLPGTMTLAAGAAKEGVRVSQSSISSSQVKLHIPTLAVGQSIQFEYQVRIKESVTSGRGLINSGTVSGQNFASVETTETVLLVDPFGIVFAARGGLSTPVPGANVKLLTDTSSNILLDIPPGAGLAPNIENRNPDIADSSGRYNFSLSPGQLGLLAAAQTYYLQASAPGFMTRMLKVSVSATHSGLFSGTFSAIDGQAIAGTDGESLVRDAVTIEDLGSLSPNIPMFESHSLEIDKAVDKQSAQIGDVLTYTINIHNPTSVTISDVILRDTLPQSFTYASGSAMIKRIDTSGLRPLKEQPSAINNEFSIALGELNAAGHTQIQYRVRIGVNAQEYEQFNQAVVSGRFPNGDVVQTEPARVSVNVSSGVFSNRQIILGRVYEDTNRNRRFDKDDLPIAGARVYLMNGQYVVTDPSGLYNFPTLSDGAVVIALDPISVSPGLKLEDDEQISGRSWGRMLRTPLGGGSLLHQDFALVRATPVSSARPSLIERDNVSLIKTSVVTPVSVDQNSLRAGTYKVAATEKLAPVKPGSALIINPVAGSVIGSFGPQLQVCVAIEWKVLLEINGKAVSDNHIGETRVDHANQITTYIFAGLGFLPGPNKIRITPIGPKNERGTPDDITVMGRGPARRIEIVTESKTLRAGEKDALVASIRAFDEWDNPALDGLVAIEGTNVLVKSLDGATSSEELKPSAYSGLPSLDGKTADLTRQPVPAVRQINDLRSQLGIPLKDGEARIKLVAPGTPAIGHVKVVMLQAVAELELRILAETRPTLLVGLGEASFGNVPGVDPGGADAIRYRGRLAFFFRGTIQKKNILTLSYDSLRPLNQTAGQNRLFQLDPLERAYPVFGDSSSRFEEAQSNSRVYLRFDHERSYAMFGDFDADMSGQSLAGYSRKLTGVKLHLEDRGGGFITVTGARPGTSFARDVIPGGSLSLVQLTHGEILAGSENVALEIRDRRNPEVIVSTEPLIRSVDYNLDPITGQIFFLRSISTFDYSLNLTQIVVTYEYRAKGMNSLVLTGRAVKKFPTLGLELGLSVINQRQDQLGNFGMGGADLVQTLPRRGVLKAAAVWSRGGLPGYNTSSLSSASSGETIEHDGFAYEIDYTQPVSFHEGVVHARLASASAGFLNPFGPTVTPGARRGEVSFGFKLRPSSTARLAFSNERNKTDRVDNSRSTFSFAWTEALKDNFKLNLGYDFRKLSDNTRKRDVTSNLFTLGTEWQATKKLGITAKREQNLGTPDPTYPDQTTLGANYQINNWAKLFFTQRIASAPIVPIADTTGTGFSFSPTRSEMALGIETKVSRFTSLTSRYQIDNGANTTDSFAVVGLINRLPVNKQLSLELGYERGFHLKGEGKNFNSITLGAGWQPKENFVSNFRYEMRDRNGLEHLFVVGAAGRINSSITALSRFQFAQTKSAGTDTNFTDGMAAMAIRPATNDRMGLLFSYSRYSRETDHAGGLTTTRDRVETLATDAFYQLTQKLEFSARLAARFNANGQDDKAYVSTLTYLAQGRMQYHFAKRFDFAAELRGMFQPKSGTGKKSYGTEVGYWPLPDLRLGLGYNFFNASEPAGNFSGPRRRGFYFVLSTKLSNLFDLFGASRKELATGPGQTAGGEVIERSQSKAAPK